MDCSDYSGCSKHQLGKSGELIAEKYLQTQGYHILEHNFHSRAGEIDIVAKEKEVLVFVEVKTYHPRNGIFPEDGVTWTKRRRLIQTARYYLAKHHLDSCQPCRFDVVAIYGEDIRLIRDAFGEGE